MGVKYIEDINDDEMDKWIFNLRSGAFSQTRRALARGDESGKVGFCCLGVQAAGCGALINDEGGPVFGLWFEENHYGYLPPRSTLERLNLPERYFYNGDSGDVYETASVRVEARPGDPSIMVFSGGVHDGTISVTTLNDTVELDFNQIADRLEDTFLRPEFKK